MRAALPLVPMLLGLLRCAALTPSGKRLAGVAARGGKRSRRQRSDGPAGGGCQFRAQETGLAPEVIGVLDFECTCEPGWGYVHEIIEFPCVLLDTRTREITDSFHSFVRPTENATLSSFCTELTGIEQATVASAPTLPEVLERLDAWLRERGLVGDAPAAKRDHARATARLMLLAKLVGETDPTSQGTLSVDVQEATKPRTMTDEQAEAQTAALFELGETIATVLARPSTALEALSFDDAHRALVAQYQGGVRIGPTEEETRADAKAKAAKK